MTLVAPTAEGTPTIGAGAHGPILIFPGGRRLPFNSPAITEARREMRRIALLPPLGPNATAEQRENLNDRMFVARMQLGYASQEFFRSHGGDPSAIRIAPPTSTKAGRSCPQVNSALRRR